MTVDAGGDVSALKVSRERLWTIEKVEGARKLRSVALEHVWKGKEGHKEHREFKDNKEQRKVLPEPNAVFSNLSRSWEQRKVGSEVEHAAARLVPKELEIFDGVHEVVRHFAPDAQALVKWLLKEDNPMGMSVEALKHGSGVLDVAGQITTCKCTWHAHIFFPFILFKSKSNFPSRPHSITLASPTNTSPLTPKQVETGS